MDQRYSAAEQRLILKKLDLLQQIKNGDLSHQDVARQRIKKKEIWCDDHLDALLEKYEYMLPEEQALHIIYFEHLGLDPEGIIVNRVSPYKLRIESHNFCPYFIASQMLDMDTRLVCRKTGEPAFQALASRVNTGLKFSRNYHHIRPYAPFCEEFIELTR